MAEKTRIIEIVEKGGAFSSILKRFRNEKEDYNFKDLAILRQIFSNEKARMMNMIKSKNPSSIYQLAKLLGRDFKSVRDDLKLLEKFGFIELIPEKSKNRINHRPILTTTTINIIVKI